MPIETKMITILQVSPAWKPPPYNKHWTGSFWRFKKFAVDKKFEEVKGSLYLSSFARVAFENCRQRFLVFWGLFISDTFCNKTIEEVYTLYIYFFSLIYIILINTYIVRNSVICHRLIRFKVREIPDISDSAIVGLCVAVLNAEYKTSPTVLS